MNRRNFLRVGAAAWAWGLSRSLHGDERTSNEVMTVAGPLDASEMGTTLVHEHVLVDFIGADQVSPARYDADEVFKVALPHLRRVRELGCQTLIECTPAYLGRDPRLLQRLAEASGLHLLTNTGYYGARQGKFLPPHTHSESADQLAQRWLREWRDGIPPTKIRPGFIKIGVDAGPLTAVNRKLVQAAARTHHDSGLTIAAHTGDGVAAMEELKLVTNAGLDGSAFIWVHAQNESDAALHARAAEQGAWVEFDGISPTSVERHVKLVQNMKQRGLLGRVLVSHDAGWYHVGEPGGGRYRSYETLFTEFVPALREAGFSAADIRQLLIENPKAAFTIRARARR
ncbi:MAG: phosphotriesterase [Gemmataceae bacterium]